MRMPTLEVAAAHVVASALVAMVAMGACKKDSQTKQRPDDTDDTVGPEHEKRPPPVPSPEPPDDARGPRLLLTHENRLYQVAPIGTASPVSALDELVIESVHAIADGTALVAVAHLPGANGRELWRIDVEPYRAQRLLTDVAWKVFDVSDDGAVILTRDLDVVFLRGGDVEIVPMQLPAGDLVYRAVVSSDGTKAAFSYRARDCRDQVAKCRVGLWGADLTKRPIVAHAIVDGDRMTYDPQFLGDAGDEVLYLSNEADRSEACLDHAARCRYDLLARRFDGSGGKQHVQSEAILGIHSPDGAKLAYAMVTNEAIAGAGVSWTRQSIFVKPAGGSPVRLAEAVAANNGVQWSADSRWISFTLTDGPPRGPRVRIARVDGGGGRDVGQGVPIGWIAQPLPRGADVMPDPVLEGDDVMALLRENGAHVMGAPLALLGFSDAIVARASTYRPQPLDDMTGLETWLALRDRSLAAITRADLCALYTRRAVVPYSVIAERGEAYLVTNELAAGQRAIDPVRRQIVDREPADVGVRVNATFDATLQGGGIVELIGVDMPAAAKRGEHFRMKLTWKIQRAQNADWRVFVHFDGPGVRFQADHAPGLCSVTVLRPGDYLIDEFEVIAGEVIHPLGAYSVYVGWYASVARAKVTAGTHDDSDRVNTGTLVLE